MMKDMESLHKAELALEDLQVRYILLFAEHIRTDNNKFRVILL